MQILGMMAIGFVLGVLVTVLFGHRIAVMVAEESKAVAFDAGRVVSDASNRIKATVGAMEVRLHAKLDALKGDAAKDVQAVEKKL